MNHQAVLGHDSSPSTYRIHVQGVQAGRDVAQVAESLALRFKRPAAKVAALLSGRAVVLKRGLTLEAAQRYAATLERAGCQWSIQAEGEEPEQPSGGAAPQAEGLPARLRAVPARLWAVAAVAVLVVGAASYSVVQRQATAASLPIATAPVATLQAKPVQPAFKARDVAHIAIARDGTIYAGASPGLYRSTDGGRNWVMVKGIDTSVFTLTPQGHLFAIEQGLLFKSTNRGESFTRIASTAAPGAESPAALPSHAAGRLYAANAGLIVSADEGKTWSHAFTESDGGRVHTAPDGTLYFGSETIVASSDKGQTWQPLARPSEHATPFMAVRADGTLFAATYALNDAAAPRLWATRDKGKTWFREDDGLPRQAGYNVTFLLALADGSMLATGHDGDVYRLPSDGGPWTKASDGLPGTAQCKLVEKNVTPGVHSIAQAPNGDVYAGTRHGVFVSRDKGRSWAPALEFKTWF